MDLDLVTDDRGTVRGGTASANRETVWGGIEPVGTPDATVKHLIGVKTLIIVVFNRNYLSV